MAMWRYEIEYPDGTRETRVIAAGNGRAARERADRHAEGLGGQRIGEPEAFDPHRGSM